MKYAKVIGLASLFVLWGVLSAGVQLRFKGGLQGKEEDTGRQVMVVAQGDEYTVQVVCDGTSDALDTDRIEKMPGFIVSRGGISNNMTMINGRTTTTTTYTFQVQPIELGFYTIGPVQNTENGRVVESNSINVRVVSTAAYDQFAGKKGAARQALKCSMSVDKHEIFVGEQAVVTVTVEDDGQVHERGLQPPTFLGALQGQPIGKPVPEQKLVNGQLKVVTVQQYLISADKPGTYTIDPASAHFIVPDEEREFGGGGLFGSFFGPSGKKRVLRSNSSIVAVKPLPLSNDPVDAVGTIEWVTLQPQKSILDLNEPCALTFSCCGTCNFDALTAPALQLPDVVSVYPSTQSFKADSQHPQKGTKSFEYVIQIGDAGEHQIPAQRFVYFDTQAGVYKTISTEPFMLQVKQQRRVQEGGSQDFGKKEQKAQAKESAESSLPLVEAGVVPIIPWWMLIVLVLVVGLWIFKDVVLGMVATLGEVLGVTSPEKRERAQLKIIVDSQSIEQVHQFFLMILERQGMSDLPERDADFNAYLDACSQAAFAPHMMKESLKTELLERAPQWYAFVCRESERSKK